MNPEIFSIHIAFSMRRYFLCLWREHFKELFFNSMISFIHLESRHLTHCRLAHRLDVWTADSLKGSSFFLNFRCCSAAQSCPTLCDPWAAAHQPCLCFTLSWSLFKLTSIESMMPSSHLILCRPLFLLTSIFPSIRVFSNESALHIRWPEYWGFSFSISPSNE